MSQPRIRHVWVRREYDPRTVPGFVMEWQQREDGVWWARVLHAVEGAVLIDWVAGSSLEPIKSEPYTGSAYG